MRCGRAESLEAGLASNDQIKDTGIDDSLLKKRSRYAKSYVGLKVTAKSEFAVPAARLTLTAS